MGSGRTLCFRSTSVGWLGRAAGLLGLVFVMAACSAEPAGVRDVEPDQLESVLSEQALLLDVRRPDEFAAGHVPGAVNVPHDQLASRLAELGVDRDAPVVVYCESGRRAGMATEVLLGAGFEDVRHLVGDMAGWRESGRPQEGS